MPFWSCSFPVLRCRITQGRGEIGLLEQYQLISFCNAQLRLRHSLGECQDLPLLTEEMVSCWVTEGKFSNQQYYSQAEFMMMAIKLLIEEKTERIMAAKNQQGKARYKEWANRRKKRIEQKEDVLWSRKKYRRQLDEMTEEWPIPNAGFSTDKEERAFRNWLSKNKLRDTFVDKLREIVSSNHSSRLQLGDEWIWAVERHLFSRSRARQGQINLAVLMVEMMSPPQIEIKWDTRGNPIEAYLTTDSSIPEDVLTECKKELKALERNIILKERVYEGQGEEKRLVYEGEVKLQAKKREKVAHRRDRAKELYENPEKATLHKDNVLSQRYKKVVEE